uniref:Uncharacterized protein n=1 Tax=Meloidogyne incognita TaxID=6306 RepID=A0A914MTD8_MELIC
MVNNGLLYDQEYIQGNNIKRSLRNQLVYPTQRVLAYKMRYARTGGFVYLKHMYDSLKAMADECNVAMFPLIPDETIRTPYLWSTCRFFLLGRKQTCRPKLK